MRKIITFIMLGTALLSGLRARAQYNREYFFWMGQRCMMDRRAGTVAMGAWVAELV